MIFRKVWICEFNVWRVFVIFHCVELSRGSSLGVFQDLEILVSWNLDLEELTKNSAYIREQIGEIPLLWLNESSLDERIKKRSQLFIVMDSWEYQN